MDFVGELHTEPTKKIGEDTEAVSENFGYTKEEIERLRKDGIIN